MKSIRLGFAVAMVSSLISLSAFASSPTEATLTPRHECPESSFVLGHKCPEDEKAAMNMRHECPESASFGPLGHECPESN